MRNNILALGACIDTVIFAIGAYYAVKAEECDWHGKYSKRRDFLILCFVVVTFIWGTAVLTIDTVGL